MKRGGTSTLQAAMPVKLKSPPTSRFQVGGTSALQAWLPAKLKSPPLQAQVRGGSRWADLAVLNAARSRIPELAMPHPHLTVTLGPSSSAPPPVVFAKILFTIMTAAFKCRNLFFAALINCVARVCRHHRRGRGPVKWTRKIILGE